MNWQIVRAGQHFHLINLSLKPKRIVCTFQRSTFRNVLDAYSVLNQLSTQWVGCILRKFLKEFPVLVCFPEVIPKPEDYAPLVLVEYLQSKGYQVYKSLPFPDFEIISYLTERWGYTVEQIAEPKVEPSYFKSGVN